MPRHGYQRHPVQLPDVPSREQLADTQSIIATLYTIEPVDLHVVFDADEAGQRVQLHNPRSSELFELLHRANMERGTVVLLKIRGNEIRDAALARLNWFLHVHGFTRGFRGWKRARQSQEGGVTLWKSKPAWDELKTLLRF